jgi:hypothetical protein
MRILTKKIAILTFKFTVCQGFEIFLDPLMDGWTHKAIEHHDVRAERGAV